MRSIAGAQPAQLSTAVVSGVNAQNAALFNKLKTHPATAADIQTSAATTAAFAVHAGVDEKIQSCAGVCRSGSTKARPGTLSHEPSSSIAKASCATVVSKTSPSRQRTHSDRCRHHPLEHRVPGTHHRRPAATWQRCRRRSPGSRLTQWVGAPQLTGDYTWHAAGRFRKGSFRPLGPFAASNE